MTFHELITIWILLHLQEYYKNFDDKRPASMYGELDKTSLFEAFAKDW